MYHVFAHRDVHRSRRHANIVQRYLSGQNHRKISGILESWITSPDDAGYEQDLYDYTTPYTDIDHVRGCLTAFAAQMVEKKLVKDVKAAVKNMKAILTANQGLFYHYVLVLATPDPVNRHGVVAVRRYRPPELTAISTVAMIDFCRNHHARLYPLVRGILYMASHVPIDIITLNSHLGTMPSVGTIKSVMKGFSNQKALKIRSMGRDTAIVEVNGAQMVKATIIIFDNSQHFRRQRERRIGRENVMVIGISATFIQFLVDCTALDPADKRFRISLNLRRTITVGQILQMIDFPHLRNVGVLQFIQALATYIPEAAIYKPEISLRYKTRCRKRQVPLAKSDIHTLASSGKNEAYIPELKDALLDFLNQLGQTEKDFDNRLWFGGGDGMSYNNMLLVQKYLRNHTESPFQSFELMRPVLQVWHTMWTDICRIHETHWGSPLNENPATLGNSAKKIGRPAPSNLKKVDYYPAADLLALVHDTRMLDCWRIHLKCDDIHTHFTELADLNQLPSFEELEIAAKHLYDTYTSTVAQREAARDARDGQSPWAANVQSGKSWIPLAIDATSASVPKQKKKRKSKKNSVSQAPPKEPVPPPPPLPFNGDQVISDGAGFMRDASISREVASAVAVGEVGRMWEGLKVMMINFAGSGHSRYLGYLLEMSCDLELESSPALRNATLDSTVCNPSGKAGGSQACDIFQERMNRELEPIIQRKDTDYGSDHVRNMWSRNLKDIYDLKADLRDSVGLAKRSGRHKEPHAKPEVKILLKHYKDVELHHRRPGRTYTPGESALVDNFTAGIKKLQEGGGLLVEVPDEDSSSESDSDDSEDGEEPEMTPGLIHAFDGEVVVDLVDEI
ncbi:hypothetical protein DFH09DRAFT_1440647, partial [Mycena vulgaris]